MKRRAFHTHSRGGMVLMEVVVAMFIFILVAFAMVKALDAAFTATDSRNEIDLAVRGLENQLALVHATRLIVSDKDMPDDGTGVIYHETISQEQMKDEKGNMVPNMYRVVITANWKADNQPQDRSVSELVYQP